MKPIDSSKFKYFVHFYSVVLGMLARTVTVIPFVHVDGKLHIEFEVRIKKINGRPVPRNTTPIADDVSVVP